MSKPSPIDALCERWRGLGGFYEQKQYSELGDTVPTPGTVAFQLATELSRLAPLVAAVVEAHKTMRPFLSYHAADCSYNNGIGDESDFCSCKVRSKAASADAALKAYEEGR